MFYKIFGILVFVCANSLYTNAKGCNSTTKNIECYNFLSKNVATDFLTNGGRSTPKECCIESTWSTICEEKKIPYKCFTEQLRGQIVRENGINVPTCDGNKMVTAGTWCPCHWHEPRKPLVCTDPCDALLPVKRCRNGTCVSRGSSYTCSCWPGYEGAVCQNDINECQSNPCQNGATCQDRINEFKCICPPGKYGLLCDTGICHPTPADFVFVLDSSISMTETQFRKQLEFVANFTSKVLVGINDSQISVITFSTEANVEFYLNEHMDNSSIIDAVMNITFRPGSTQTDKGLRAVQYVFSGHGADRQVNGSRQKADKFVYLLTDGMSKYRAKTRQAAKELIQNVTNVQLAVIGIGDEVSHEEMLDIASNPEYIYSVNNFNSLYAVLSKLVHFTCTECEHSVASDVAIFIDSASDKLDSFRDAVSHLVNVTNHLGDDEVHFSLTTFSSGIQDILNMGKTFDKSVINMKLNSFSRVDTTNILAMENVLEHARTYVFTKSAARANAKKLLLIFSNGESKVQNQNAFKQEKFLLESMNVHIYAVASMADDDGGSNLSLPELYDLVTDPYNLFITTTDKNSYSNLNVLQNEFVYDICNLNETRH